MKRNEVAMELLKLVIVDDEPILLQGLLKTYEWDKMGFQVVGTAQSGEAAVRIIKEKNPHVVLTDIRMKQITGLMVMEEIQKLGMDTLFIVLSAYRDFEYAQQACDLGAFAYLLKPIEDERLQETMANAYRTCMEQIRNVARYESWKNLIMEDSNSFLQVIVQKYLQNRIPYEKLEEVFATLHDVIGEKDRFITVCVALDLAYKITNSLDYEAARFAMLHHLEQIMGTRFFYWGFEGEEDCHVFIIKTTDNGAVRELKGILEQTKKEQNNPVVAAISKPYRGMAGIRRSFEEARKLFEIASVSGASAFTVSEDLEEPKEEPKGPAYAADGELLIVNAVRKNAGQELKDAFVHLIYGLPQEESLQCQYMHRVMVKVESMVRESYGMTEQLQEQFLGYYSNLANLNGARSVDVCYKILCSAIEERKKSRENNDAKYFKEYLSVAEAYIESHLHDEDLSVASVAMQIYLNPVYFGRVFKNTFHMTFKKYLLKQRMERAKVLLQDGTESISAICEQVGISNPSYFSHLFKEYTGKLPSEYRKMVSPGREQAGVQDAGHNRAGQV